MRFLLTSICLSLSPGFNDSGWVRELNGRSLCTGLAAAALMAAPSVEAVIVEFVIGLSMELSGKGGAVGATSLALCVYCSCKTRRAGIVC